MRQLSFLVWVLLAVTLLSAPVLAGSLNFGSELTGMGGAGVALTNDVYASYWNPAGLTQVRKFSIAPNVAGFAAAPELAADWLAYFQGEEKPVEATHAETGAMMGFATPRFAINMGGQARGGLTPGDGVNPGYGQGLLLYNSKISMAVPFSLGYRTLSVGTTFNYFSGQHFSAELGHLWDDQVIQRQSKEQGQALDLGAQLDLTGTIRLGLVARNLFANYSWDEEHPLTDLQRVNRNYQAGLGVRFERFRAAFDWEWDDSSLRRYHLGMAKDFWKVFTIRAGSIIEPGEDPTYTGGASLRLGGLSVNLSGTQQGISRSAVVSMAVNL